MKKDSLSLSLMLKLLLAFHSTLLLTKTLGEIWVILPVS